MALFHAQTRRHVIKLHGLLFFLSVWEANPQAVASGIIVHTDAKPYYNLLIALTCICTLCFARYLMFYNRISTKGGISTRINVFII